MGAQPSVPSMGHGTALARGQIWDVRTVLTRSSLILHACAVLASFCSSSHFRNWPARQRASWAAWRAAEMPPSPPGARNYVAQLGRAHSLSQPV